MSNSLTKAKLTPRYAAREGAVRKASVMSTLRVGGEPKVMQENLRLGSVELVSPVPCWKSLDTYMSSQLQGETSGRAVMQQRRQPSAR